MTSTQPTNLRYKQIEAAALRLSADERYSLRHKLIDTAAVPTDLQTWRQAVSLTIDDLEDAMQPASATAAGVNIIVTIGKRIKAPGFITATPAKFL